MNFERELDKIRSQNQGKLPLHDRMAHNAMCLCEDNGFKCTKQVGHDSKHIAHGSLGTVIHAWFSPAQN